MQEKGSAALGIALNARQDAVVAAGGVDAVVAGMRRTRAAAVQEQGSAALANVARGGDARRDAVVAAGGVDAVLAACGRTRAAAVQEKGSGALNFANGSDTGTPWWPRAAWTRWWPACGRTGRGGGAGEGQRGAAERRADACRDAVVAAGGVDAVVAGMRAHPRGGGAGEGQRRCRTSRMAATCTGTPWWPQAAWTRWWPACGRTRARRRCRRRAARRCGTSRLATRAVTPWWPWTRWWPACGRTRARRRCRRRAAGRCGTSRLAATLNAVVAAGGVDAVVAGMRAHPAAAVQEGSAALGNVARGSDARRDTWWPRAVDAVVAACGRTRARRRCRSRAAGCCRTSRMAATRKDAVVAAGGVDAVVAGMRAHPGAAAVQEAGSGRWRTSRMAATRAVTPWWPRAAWTRWWPACGRTRAAAVQEKGSAALRNVAYGSDACRDAVVAAGSVDAVVCGRTGRGGGAGGGQRGAAASRVAATAGGGPFGRSGCGRSVGALARRWLTAS